MTSTVDTTELWELSIPAYSITVSQWAADADNNLIFLSLIGTQTAIKGLHGWMYTVREQAKLTKLDSDEQHRVKLDAIVKHGARYSVRLPSLRSAYHVIYVCRYPIPANAQEGNIEFYLYTDTDLSRQCYHYLAQRTEYPLPAILQDRIWEWLQDTHRVIQPLQAGIATHKITVASDDLLDFIQEEIRQNASSRMV